MAKPVVAIVGRPNVGKSTLFNRICEKRISIVENMPGVTRDRIYGDAEWSGYFFRVIDTGGLDRKDSTEIQRNIMNQAQLAIDLADVIVLVVDGREGLTSGDTDAADFLRQQKKPVVLAVNKLDNNEEALAYEFYQLGLGQPHAISAEQAKGVGDLLDEVITNFKHKGEVDPYKDCIKIAFIGKPNAGKSSLTNKLVGEERMVVSEVAGTTRDAIDTPFRVNGKDYVAIDTAGIRRKRSIDDESVERYSVIRSLEAIRRADVVVVMIDAMEGLSEQDVRICGIVHEENKPSVICVNKWDLIEKDNLTMHNFENKLKIDLAFMSYFKSIYISALTGQRVNKIIDMVDDVYANASRRISTSALNEIINSAVSANDTPHSHGRKLRIYYSTQVSVLPPTFVLKVNDAKLMPNHYMKYLENNVRRSADFTGTPIKIICRNKSEKD